MNYLPQLRLRRTPTRNGLRRSSLVACFVLLASASFLSGAESAPAGAVLEAPQREAVHPLYEGRTDARALQPLDAWMQRRIRSGAGERLVMEIEVRRALEQAFAEDEAKARALLEEIDAARQARVDLEQQLLAPRTRDEPAIDAAAVYASLPPAPGRTVVFPAALRSNATHQVQQNQTTTSVTVTTTSSGPRVEGAGASRATMSTGGVPVAGAFDRATVLERLAGEIKGLAQLARQTEAEIETAIDRQQRTYEVLPRVLKARHDAAMNAVRNMK